MNLTENDDKLRSVTLHEPDRHCDSVPLQTIVDEIFNPFLVEFSQFFS